MRFLGQNLQFQMRNLIDRCGLKQNYFTQGSCSIPGSTIDRTENLQRIRAFSSGHFAQRRCRTHGFFGAQHGADLHWRCADVVRVSNRNLRRRNRKMWCAARQNREKLAAISCVVHANFSKILRNFDRWMRAFAALHY